MGLFGNLEVIRVGVWKELCKLKWDELEVCTKFVQMYSERGCVVVPCNFWSCDGSILSHKFVTMNEAIQRWLTIHTKQKVVNYHHKKKRKTRVWHGFLKMNVIWSIIATFFDGSVQNNWFLIICCRKYEWAHSNFKEQPKLAYIYIELGLFFKIWMSYIYKYFVHLL